MSSSSLGFVVSTELKIAKSSLFWRLSNQIRINELLHVKKVVVTARQEI